MMKCPICKNGETRSGETSILLERGHTTIVFKRVPAEICLNCSEAYHDANVTRILLQQADLAAAKGVELDVRRYTVV